MTVSPSLPASARSAMPAVLPLLLCVAVANAQPPVLAPTTNTTITVGVGPLHYASIDIPAGVTVRFVPPTSGSGPVPGMPAVILCDGDATVHGTLSVAGNGTGAHPAGFVTTGEGLWGYVCGTGPSAYFSPPQGGSHAGTYGSVIPFSLEGGSNGGWLVVYPWCIGGNFLLSSGRSGGGTLALLAQGRIEVHGAVTADGIHTGTSSPLNNSAGGGSGGSVLLRGAGGVTVFPSGSVTARGGAYFNAHPTTLGAPGYVRLDAWGTAPDIQGTIDPPPTALELPHLRAQAPPQIGATWMLDVLAPENSPVFVAASLAAGPGTATPFGVLGLDLLTSASLAVVVPQPSHDPLASVPWPVPNAPVLIGLQLWVQAFAVPQALPPRLSNTVFATVG